MTRNEKLTQLDRIHVRCADGHEVDTRAIPVVSYEKRPVFKLETGVPNHFLGLLINNFNHNKPMYVRLGKRSITISDRKPAKYGRQSGG